MRVDAQLRGVLLRHQSALLPALDALRRRVSRLSVHLGLRDQDLRVAASAVRNAIGRTDTLIRGDVQAATGYQASWFR
jgi:hypothetical protein